MSKTNWLKKKWFWLLALALVVVAGFIIFSLSGDKADPNIFIVKPVDLIQRVSVTGKVKANQKAELAFKQSGFIVSVDRAVGERVEAGEILARIDNRDALQALSDAEAALETARVNLAKLEHPSTEQAVSTKLTKARQDGLAVLARAFADLGDTLDVAYHIYFDRDYSSNSSDNNLIYFSGVVNSYGSRFKTVPLLAGQAYASIKPAYTELFNRYQHRESSADGLVEEKLITDAHQFLKQVGDFIKLGRDLVQFFYDRSVDDGWTVDKASLVREQLDDLNTELTKINGYLAELGAIANTISQERLNSNTNIFSLESQAVTVKEKEASFINAQAKLADYAIRAPFAGVITKQEARVGEFATAGAVLVGLITDGQLVVEANVPEVDIAKLKLTYSASVTLDAYGQSVKFLAKVIAIDPAETIIEGVPTYKVTLAFDEQSAQIRSGMTANIDLLTGERKQVLAVPLRAVKFNMGGATVLLRGANGDEERQVTTGLQASDGQIEIVSGLDPSDEVVLPE